MPNYTDVGTACCETILQAISDVVTTRGLDAPAVLVNATGASIPTGDACDGMVWVRVASQYPTDGSGQPFTRARIGSDVPVWAVAIEVGHLWCHQNIDEDGSWIDQATEAQYAARDGAWRAGVLEALAYGWLPETGDLAEAVQGQSIGIWTPIGPDGGLSGGIVVATVVVSALALCDWTGP